MYIRVFVKKPSPLRRSAGATSRKRRSDLIPKRWIKSVGRSKKLENLILEVVQ
jgi:hypothetical protein